MIEPPGSCHATDALTRRYADPFGTPRGAAGTAWVGDHGSLNKATDAAIGLTQVGARYLDTVLGRFISVDPVMDLADPQQWNAYAYSNNNPTTMTDPTGLWPKWLNNAAKSVGNGLKAANNWVKKNQATIVGVTAGIVVGAACEAITAGAGSVLCGMAAGAIGNAVSNLWASKVQHTTQFSWKSLALDVGLGVAVGGAGAVLGKGLSTAASRLLGRAPGMTGQLSAKTLAGARGSAVPASRAAATTVASDGAGDGVSLALKYKDGWTAVQRAAADAKVAALNEADDLVVTEVQRAGTSASARYLAARGVVPTGSDVDHIIDLQLGGADDILNMGPLDRSVNRSLGAQIGNQIRGVSICSS